MMIWRVYYRKNQKVHFIDIESADNEGSKLKAQLQLPKDVIIIRSIFNRLARV